MEPTPTTKPCPCYYSTLFAQQEKGKNKVMNMMLKMGYQEGQGLGRSLQGIVEPVQAKSNFKRSGLGVISYSGGRKFYCTCHKRKLEEETPTKKPTKVGPRYKISMAEIFGESLHETPVEIDLTEPENDDGDDKVIDLTSEKFTNAVNVCKLKCEAIAFGILDENFLNSSWIPSFEELLEMWTCEDYAIMVQFILEIKNFLPNHVFNDILKKVADKLRSKILNWNPWLEHAHTWIEPWREILENTLDDTIIEKLNAAVRKWLPDEEPHFLLDPWRQYFNNEELFDIASNIMLNLEVVLSEMDFDNDSHDSELWSYITGWFDFLNEITISDYINALFIPKFEKKFIYFKQISKCRAEYFLNRWEKKFSKNILAQQIIQKYFENKHSEISNMIDEKNHEIISIDLDSDLEN